MVVERGPNGGGEKYFGNFQGGGKINFPRQFHSCRPRMFARPIFKFFHKANEDFGAKNNLSFSSKMLLFSFWYSFLEFWKISKLISMKILQRKKLQIQIKQFLFWTLFLLVFNQVPTSKSISILQNEISK